MANLPLLKIIKNEIELPDSKKKITIRPYLTGEEKGLLMAIESNNDKSMREAIRNLIQACVTGPFDIDSLSTLDLEFIFIQLRKISVSEEVTISLFHADMKECDHAQPVTVKLDAYEITAAPEKKIVLDDENGVGVVMKTPTINMFEKMDTKSSNVTKTFAMIYACIDYVFDAEEVYNNFSKDELKAWVDQLTESQLKKIMDFFESVPKMTYHVKYQCEKCGKEETRDLDGILNFL